MTCAHPDSLTNWHRPRTSRASGAAACGVSQPMDFESCCVLDLTPKKRPALR